MNLNQIVAPVLREHGKQIAFVDCTYNQATLHTVFSVQCECGTIYTVRIPHAQYATAVHERTAGQLLVKYLQDAINGTESPVSEVQPVSDGPATSGGSPEPHTPTVSEEFAGVEATDPS